MIIYAATILGVIVGWFLFGDAFGGGLMKVVSGIALGAIFGLAVSLLLSKRT